MLKKLENDIAGIKADVGDIKADGGESPSFWEMFGLALTIFVGTIQIFLWFYYAIPKNNDRRIVHGGEDAIYRDGPT